jgi:hypothetical protein
MRKKIISTCSTTFAIMLFLATLMPILVSPSLVPPVAASPGLLIADSPSVVVGTGASWMGDGWWVRYDSTYVTFTFTRINTALIPNDNNYVVVNFDLMVTNHVNGEEGLDGLVNVTINPGSAMTYSLADVLFDNLDPTNHAYLMNTGGTYDTNASILINKAYIQNGTLVIEVHRHPDTTPVYTATGNVPIDMSTDPPTIPPNVYEGNDPRTVHIHVYTDPTGTVARSGQVTIWVMTASEVVADSPSVVVGTGASWMGDGWWVRYDSTYVTFTFTRINTALIASSHVEVMFDLYVTNHVNGEEGLDGLVNVTINPGSAMTYSLADVLFDNLDPTNHAYSMGTGGTYETEAVIEINKAYIQNGTLVIEVHRHPDTTPVYTATGNVPIDMSTDPPTIPPNVYEGNDPRTVHIHVYTDPTGTVARSGQVTIYSKEVSASSVGGVVVPTDKLALLGTLLAPYVPYVGLISVTLMAVAVAVAIYVKHVKRRKEKR